MVSIFVMHFREKTSPPSLSAQKHPHGNEYVDIHPQYNEERNKELGNDNSSNQRQSRSQSGKPDPVPGKHNFSPSIAFYTKCIL